MPSVRTYVHYPHLRSNLLLIGLEITCCKHEWRRLGCVFFLGGRRAPDDIVRKGFLIPQLPSLYTRAFGVSYAVT